MAAVSLTSNVIAFGGNTMVYESVKRFSLKGLNDLIRVLMENIDDALFELSEKVDNNKERTMYFDAMREIRLKRKAIVEKFDTEVKQSFDDLILNKSSRIQKKKNDELSLVASDELEDHIAIDNMITKARPNFEDDLFAVVERFKVILHRKNLDQDLNPLDPKTICNSFHNASESLEAEIQVKLIFYKMFDKFVMANMGHFYQELNDFFVQKGVLPEFKAAEERVNQASLYLSNRVRNSVKKQTEESFIDNDSDLVDQVSPNASTAPSDQNLLTILQQLASTGTNQQGVVTNAPTALFNAGHKTFQPGAQNNRAETYGQMNGPVPINASYMAALTNLQTTALPIQSVQVADPQHVKQELQQQLINFRQDNSHQSSEAENQIIDIVSMLFDFFFDDVALPDPVKVLIGRLQIPILKVALMDKTFFNHKKHPARRLLDGISKASLGWSSDQEQEKILIEKIEQVVDFLLQEFDQDIAVFDLAMEDFQQFLDAENKKIDQELEQVRLDNQQKDEQIALAQQASSDLIERLQSRHELSFGVTDFLEGIWRSVLFNTHLTLGEDSNHWKNLKKISYTFLWTLIPKNSEKDKTKLLKTLPPLLRALANGMALIQIKMNEQNQFFQMLVGEHAKIMKQTSRNIVTREDDKTVWPRKYMDNLNAALKENGGDSLLQQSEEFDEEDDTFTKITRSSTQDVIKNLDDFVTSIEQGDIQIDEEIILQSNEQFEFDADAGSKADDYLDQVNDLEIGAWVEFRKENDFPEHIKLSWKSNVTGKYVFVNRKGIKVKNMTAYSLSSQLRSGQARLIESVSVFDRAISSLMSTLRH